VGAAVVLAVVLPVQMPHLLKAVMVVITLLAQAAVLEVQAVAERLEQLVVVVAVLLILVQVVLAVQV
jgi:hypothetical protein